MTRYYQSSYYVYPVVYVQEETAWRSYGVGGQIHELSGQMSSVTLNLVHEISKEEAQRLIAGRFVDTLLNQNVASHGRVAAPGTRRVDRRRGAREPAPLSGRRGHSIGGTVRHPLTAFDNLSDRRRQAIIGGVGAILVVTLATASVVDWASTASPAGAVLPADSSTAHPLGTSDTQPPTTSATKPAATTETQLAQTPATQPAATQAIDPAPTQATQTAQTPGTQPVQTQTTQSTPTQTTQSTPTHTTQSVTSSSEFAGGKLYVDSAYGYAITYPSGWSLQQTPADAGGDSKVPGSIRVVDKNGLSSAGWYVNMAAVDVYQLEAPVDQSQFPAIKSDMEQALLEAAAQDPSVKIIERTTETSVGMLEGFRTTMSTEIDGIPTTYTEYQLYSGTLVYAILLQAASDEWAGLQSTFAHMLDSFEPGPQG